MLNNEFVILKFNDIYVADIDVTCEALKTVLCVFFDRKFY